MSYAIIEMGGKQYRVAKGDSVVVDRVHADEGTKVTPRAVMYSGDETILDGDDLGKVKVEAVVAEHLKGPKLRIFKYRAKKRYRKSAGHRSLLTRLEISDVKLLSRKPAGAAAKKEPAEGSPAAKKKETASSPQRSPAAEADSEES